MKNSKMKKSSARELNSGGWVVNRTLENLMRTIDKYGDMLEEDTLARPDLGVDWWTAEYIAENIEKAIGELQKYADELRQYANSGERRPIEEWQNAFDKSAKKSKVAKSDVTIDANTYLMCYGADGYKHTKVKIPKNIRLRAGGELYFLDSTPSKDYGHKYPWAVEYHSGPKSNKFALYVYLDAEDGKILARVNRSDGTYVADTYDYLQRDCSDMEQKLSQIYDWFDEVLSNQKAQELDSEAEDRLYYASAKKSYTPDYQDFRSMVGSIRNTRDHNKVFKE